MMKKQFLSIMLATMMMAGVAQTATDFTTNDCNGVSYNLFTELEMGKVIVICWVMPCASCTGPALTTYNVVQSFQASHPNTVILYMVDDYANTPCSSLNSWINSYGMTNTTRFVSSDIDMTDYGSTGMPKIVVLGGGVNHTVFYNVNNTVSASQLQSTINTALITTGLQNQYPEHSSLRIIPNPGVDLSEIKFSLQNPSDVNLDLYNLQGQLLDNIFTGRMDAGENSITMDVTSYSAGVYLVKLSEGDRVHSANLVVSP